MADVDRRDDYDRRGGGRYGGRGRGGGGYKRRYRGGFCCKMLELALKANTTDCSQRMTRNDTMIADHKDGGKSDLHKECAHRS